MKKILLILLLCQSYSVFSQVVKIDSTFGIDGILNHTIGTVGFPLKVLGDGFYEYSIEYSDPNTFLIKKYKNNGSIDNNFGTGGLKTIQYTDSYNGLIFELLDSTFIEARYFEETLFLKKYTKSFDPIHNFNLANASGISMNGAFISRVSCLFANVDRIYLCYFAAYAADSINLGLLVINHNGSIDSTFGLNGKVEENDIYDMISYRGYLISKNILALEPDLNLFKKYNSNGKIDSTFGINGRKYVSFDATQSLGLVSYIKGVVKFNNIFFLSGDLDSLNLSIPHKMFIMKIDSNCVLDSTFGTNGRFNIDYNQYNNLEAGTFLIAKDSSIYFTCKIKTDGLNEKSIGIIIYKINAFGKIDSSFGFNGYIVDTNYNDIIDLTWLDEHSFLATLRVRYSDETIFQNHIVKYILDFNTGILNLSSSKNNLIIYPNPIANEASLLYTLDKEEKISIYLFDINGKQIQTFVNNITQPKGEHTQHLQLINNIPSGNYFIIISNGKGEQSIKVIVK